MPQVRLTFELVDSLKQMTLPHDGGLTQSVEGLNRIKGWVRKNSFLLPDCLWAETSVFCLSTRTQAGTCTVLLQQSQYSVLHIQVLSTLSRWMVMPFNGRTSQIITRVLPTTLTYPLLLFSESGLTVLKLSLPQSSMFHGYNLIAHLTLKKKIRRSSSLKTITRKQWGTCSIFFSFIKKTNRFYFLDQFQVYRKTE